MLKVDSNGSSSSVMETQQTIKQSKWLQENVRDVDERVKTILELIEGDADSFAQRAENYYQKRPHLVKEVEGFYRAYRSLAATVAGNVHPKESQSPGVSFDSRTSLFGKQLQFKNRSNSGTLKDSDLMQGERNVQELEGAESNEHSAESSDISSIDPKTSPLSAEQEESLSFSDSDYEHRNEENVKVQRVLVDLRAENKDLLEESKRLVEERDVARKLLVNLQQEVSKLQESNSMLRNEATLHNDKLQVLQNEVSSLLKEKVANESAVKKLEAEILFLREKDKQSEKDIVAGAERLDVLEDELRRLEIMNLNLESQVMVFAEKEKASMAALRFLKGETVSFLKKNKKLQEDIEDITEQKITANTLLINREAEVARLNKELQELRTTSSKAHENLVTLEENNNRQKILLADLSEEKRNAIKQLCFYIEVMKEKNSRLRESIFIYKKKFEEIRPMVRHSGRKSLVTN